MKDAVWINAEAGAGQSATTLAAAAGYAFDTGLIAAQVGYMNSAAPLLTSAQQNFNAAFVQAYAAAVNNDPDQVAVAGAWQQYSDALASDYQTLLTQAASAFQQAGDSVATAAQTLANQVAAEGVTEADSITSAWTTFVGNVTPAAKTLAYSEADAAKMFSDTAVDEGRRGKSSGGSFDRQRHSRSHCSR